MPTLEELIDTRKNKLKELKKRGIDPYPSVSGRTKTVAEARDASGSVVVITGRIMAMRGHGKIVFCDMVDLSGKVQVVLKQDMLDADSFSLVSLLDMGDFVEAEGTVGTTQAGELSIFATRLRLLSKSIRPLPDKWHGLKDVEERYRQRYVDLVVNPGVREVFLLRTKVVRFLRNYFDADGFLEVETPVLQPIYGGASAKPFVTHHNALDADLYLRISDELYLKRLIAGGFEKVYEISKDFRNEGIDRQHNPEFTMMEFYWAYADYEKLMAYTEKMIAKLVVEVCGSSIITYQGETIDFSGTWERKSYRDVVMEFTGIDINIAQTESQLLSEIKAKKIQLDLTGVVGYGAMLDTLYKATARPHLVGPMFLTDRPTAFVTLAKRLPHDPHKTASFQLLIAGKEVINAYNELNDPEDQSVRWRESEKLGEEGQDEHEAFDHDYIRALEYGMPPTAGWGMGIDRLVSILTDQASLKDVILFPTLRPEFQKKEKAVVADSAIDEKDIVTKDQAMDLLHAHMQNVNLRRHCYAVGYAMAALAEKLGGNADVWEVLGILHDADWEETKDGPEEHTKKTLEWLSHMGVSKGPIVKALQSHNRKLTKLAEIESVMEWALETVDELTGFIVAVALVRPDKKLETVELSSIMKKWKTKEFAKPVDREHISQCEEKLGIPLPEFIEITLRAMQAHHDELGL